MHSSPLEHPVNASQAMTIPHEAGWPLVAGEVLAVPPARSATRGRWLAATAGRLWLTRDGGGADREADVWLQPGERHWLAPGSAWLIEAWGASSFVLLEPPPTGRTASRAAPRAPSRPGFPWLRPGVSSS